MPSILKTVTEQLRTHLLESRGVYSGHTHSNIHKMPSLEELKQTEWCPEFEQHMRNCLIMGSFRYGRLHKTVSNSKPSYDHVTSCKQRLELYEQDGNAQHLVDVANLCLVEFVEENHKNFHYYSNDDGYHSPVKEENK